MKMWQGKWMKMKSATRRNTGNGNGASDIRRESKEI